MPLAKCVKVRVHFQDGGNLQYAFNVRLQSTSYSWWDDGRVDSRIAGKDIGINVDNSGTFADLANRGNGVRQAQFGGNYWYDRGGSAGYAINAQDALVMATADTIASSLPEGRTDNAYAFARATFDYLHAYISYDRDAPSTARSDQRAWPQGRGIVTNKPTPTSASCEPVECRGGTLLVSSATRFTQTRVGRRTHGVTFSCP